MSRTGSDGPEDVDATFEAIVADLRAQGFDEADTESDPTAGPSAGPIAGGETRRRRGTEPESRDDADGTDRASDRPSDPAPGAPGAGTGWRDNPVGWDETMLGPDPADDDEHFVPPEPPPLPKPRKGAFVVLLFFVIGLLALSAPAVIGISPTVGTPLGMLALATGIALLLLRVKQDPPDGADPSNGAQV